MKPKVLIVGENPFAFSGNAHFCYTMASLVDTNKYDLKVFAATSPDMIPDHYTKIPFDVINGIEGKAKFCGEHLCHLLATNSVDIVIFVGLDCWAYHQVFKTFVQLHEEKKFIWCSIFPYDLYQVRQDWLYYIKPIDLPCVYSEYGHELLHPVIPNIQYFRPQLFEVNTFKSLDKRLRKEERRKIFSTVADDVFIFGFIGNNQWRKDPLRAIKAFFNVKKRVPNTIMYMHTETTKGVFNIPQYIVDCGGKPGDIFLKQDNARFSDLSKVYNAIDCLVNTSLQEGLSWTLLEAMLCECPVIAADNTAQSELIADGAGYPIPCTDLAFVPSQSPSGLTSLESGACNFEALVTAMVEVATKPDVRESLIQKGKLRATNWTTNTSDINALIESAVKMKSTRRPNVIRKGVLFAQHSAAGDVLMSTQCFKGIKERHKNQPLIYMTQPQFQDIIKGNPHIDEIIDWDESVMKEFTTIYNPHGDHILKGRFNRLDATLYSLYPHFCRVKPDEMFIECVPPDMPALKKPYAVVHTTGGEPKYRTYEHMNLIVDKIGMPCVQIGGSLDRACRNVLDLRGKLSYRETAFIMKNAAVAVVIDSFPSHLAGHLRTPVVTLFGPAPARVTRPRAEEGKSLNIEPNLLDVCPDLGGCWSESINGCASPCINTIFPMTVIAAVKELLK